jgi:hypothetical protein
VQITVKVPPEHARALQMGEPATADGEELVHLLDDQDITLTPLHPQTDDATLASWFTVDVPDDRADDVVNALRSSAAVEAAYVKPADEPP